MSSRKDIMAPRSKRDGGTYWVKLGTAWFNDKGGIQLVFDALPIPDSEGRVVANLFEPKERTGGAPGATSDRTPAAYTVSLDDDVPFATADAALEWKVG